MIFGLTIPKIIISVIETKKKFKIRKYNTWFMISVTLFKAFSFPLAALFLKIFCPLVYLEHCAVFQS